MNLRAEEVMDITYDINAIEQLYTDIMENKVKNRNESIETLKAHLVSLIEDLERLQEVTGATRVDTYQDIESWIDYVVKVGKDLAKIN